MSSNITDKSCAKASLPKRKKSFGKKSFKDMEAKIKATMNAKTTEELDDIRRKWQKHTRKAQQESLSSPLSWYPLKSFGDQIKGSRIDRLIYETQDCIGRYTLDELLADKDNCMNTSQQASGVVGIHWLKNGSFFLKEAIIFLNGTPYMYKGNSPIMMTGKGNIRLFKILSEHPKMKHTQILIIHKEKSPWQKRAKRAAKIMKIIEQNIVGDILMRRRGYITPAEEITTHSL